MVFCLVPFLLHKNVCLLQYSCIDQQTLFMQSFLPMYKQLQVPSLAPLLLMHDAQYTVVTAAACLVLHHARCVMALHVLHGAHQAVIQIELELHSTKSKNGSISCMVAADQEARCRLGEGCQELPAEAGRHRWPVPTVHRTQGPGN